MSGYVTIKAEGLESLNKKVANVMPGLMRAAGGMRVVAKQHYIAKNAAEPNKLMGKRTNYWAGIARSISIPQQDGNSAYIAIQDPTFWQKLKGGTITPKTKKWLTIPANSLSYGKPAASFPLQFIPLGGGLAMLVLSLGMKKAKKWKSQRSDVGRVTTVEASAEFGKGQVMYWLKKSVTQGPTQGALPPMETLKQAAQEQFNIWMGGLKN